MRVVQAALFIRLLVRIVNRAGFEARLAEFHRLSQATRKIANRLRR
jgi:hypothetical protein